MKSVGLLTMHRVLNFGSALQAYALQLKVKELGYDCEIIDYVFPNSKHLGKEKFLIRIKKLMRFFIANLLFGYSAFVMRRRFQEFYDRYFSLSPRTYGTCESIHDNPPIYDIYLTGSDQVWNPLHVKDDTTFLLSFCKGKDTPRISFASSFSTAHIPDNLKDLYAQYLNSYDRISVRENSGVDLIKNLTGKKAEVVCDPTLLLDGSKWAELANNSSIKINGPYILAYILTYSFNPHPQIGKMIDQIQEQLGLPVVFLNGRFLDYFKNNARVIRNAGPSEFIQLFKGASFIITTSLHGTAFALNFSVPFYSVTENKTEKDGRILSLLEVVGAQERALTIDDNDIKAHPMDYTQISKSLEELRNRSSSFLREALASKDS